MFFSKVDTFILYNFYIKMEITLKEELKKLLEKTIIRQDLCDDILFLLAPLIFCHECHAIKDGMSTNDLCMDCIIYGIPIHQGNVPYDIKRSGKYRVIENIIWKGPGYMITCNDMSVVELDGMERTICCNKDEGISIHNTKKFYLNNVIFYELSPFTDDMSLDDKEEPKKSKKSVSMSKKNKKDKYPNPKYNKQIYNKRPKW
jgi:hypothetical protein